MRNEGYGNGRAYSSTGIGAGRGHGIGYAIDPEGAAWVPHGSSLGGVARDAAAEVLTTPVMPPA